MGNTRDSYHGRSPAASRLEQDRTNRRGPMPLASRESRPHRGRRSATPKGVSAPVAGICHAHPGNWHYWEGLAASVVAVAVWALVWLLLACLVFYAFPSSSFFSPFCPSR